MGRALVVIVLIAVVAVATYLLIAGWREWRQTKWREAEHKAKWEDYSTTIHGETEVGVRLIATLGKRRRVMREEPLQRISSMETDWMMKVHLAEDEAKNHANVLND